MATTGKKILLSGNILLLSAVLTACNSSNETSNNATAALNGTAAVGAPIQMAEVTAKCADGTEFSDTVTTDNNGKWSATVNKNTLPCALQVTGGTPVVTLHSYANASGTVNITPLTDLILAQKTGQTPSDWFSGFANASPLDIDDTGLIQALTNAGYQVPAGSPFTTAFNANGEGWDALLDDLRQAISDDANLATYNDLMAQIRDGNSFENSLPQAPENNNPPDPELPANIDVLTAFAGTYSVSGTATEPTNRGTATRDHNRGTITISDNGDIDFDTDIRFNGTQIAAIYDRRNLCDLEPQFDRTACRVHVNYDADDSGRKLEIYLDPDKTTVQEIRYQNGQGSITRAVIGNNDETPVAQSSIAAADLATYDDSSEAAFLASVSGTWPVAIHKTPEGLEGLYGKGSLTIGGTDENNWFMTLKGADGSVIFDHTNQGMLTGHISLQARQFFINHGTGTDDLMQVVVHPDGTMIGSAGGNIEIEFRNNILAYGDVAPDIISKLAGNWEKEATVYCNGPYGSSSIANNTVTITTDAQATIDGKTQLCGGNLPKNMAWGGRNDFMLYNSNQAESEYILYLDIMDTVGISNGALEIWFSNLENPSVYSMHGFVDGELFELKNPVKQ
ncbi:hypothetical protein [Thiomicrorhabdus sp.]|uniref:hypothetical protein n=1 Tax=Thiomicrorhabdus sp. TaxID=2039724 RepID=UPI0029C68D42|nr:hypothetical protein [Thiomicrorhabdus sp.]